MVPELLNVPEPKLTLMVDVVPLVAAVWMVPVFVKPLPTPVTVTLGAVVVSVPRLVKLPPPLLTVMLLSDVIVTRPLLPETVLPMLMLPLPVVLNETAEPFKDSAPPARPLVWNSNVCPLSAHSAIPLVASNPPDEVLGAWMVSPVPKPTDVTVMLPLLV